MPKLTTQQFAALALINRSVGEGFDEAPCSAMVGEALKALNLPEDLVTLRLIDDGEGNKTLMAGLTSEGKAVLKYGSE